MQNKDKCSFLKCANSIGLFLVALFAICFLWYYIRPVEQVLHLKLFRMAYFGFRGMNVVSFVLGAVQTYIWAYVAIGIWQIVGCCFKAGKGDK